MFWPSEDGDLDSQEGGVRVGAGSAGLGRCVHSSSLLLLLGTGLHSLYAVLAIWGLALVAGGARSRGKRPGPLDMRQAGNRVFLLEPPGDFGVGVTKARPPVNHV